jgi:uncharacterized protein
MGTLAEILSSRVREAIFQLLFGRQGGELHLRELARQAGFSLGTVRQELHKLLQRDLVTTRRGGNRLYYRANTEHPLYPEIRQLVLKTVDVVEIFRSILDREGVEAAFVFGPLPSPQEKAASKIDLMVLGDVEPLILKRWLAGAPARIGRKVVFYTMTREEFRRRLEKGNKFLSQVLESPKLFIIGSEEGLAGMKHWSLKEIHKW